VLGLPEVVEPSVRHGTAPAHQNFHAPAART